MTDPAQNPSEPQLEIRIIPVTPLQQNTSMVWCRKTMTGIFIDPGGDVEKLMGAASHFGVTIKEIWLTHGHLDHAGGATEIKERTGAPIIGPHPDDQWLLDDLESQGAKYGITGCRNVQPDRYLDEGDTLELGGQTFEVAHTPGHTPGHVIMYNTPGQLAFVGDVLFKGSVGRTDFPRSSHEQLIDSVRDKLWPLGPGMRFVPGHGPMSTFGAEMQTNPFVSHAALA
ncbi:MAG: MBL fold metallo-hydrolase [Pseudomonadota bacterium]